MVGKNACPLQRIRTREAELEEEVVSLQREKKELQYNICLLKEDYEILTEEIQHQKGKTLRFMFLYRIQSNIN